MRVVGETAGPVELRAPVRVAGEDIEPDPRQRQEEGVARGEEALGGDPAHLEVPTGSFGSVTSVKRISSGSSITTCFTVYRTPR
jgi:hypothetical protein